MAPDRNLCIGGPSRPRPAGPNQGAPSKGTTSSTSKPYRIPVNEKRLKTMPNMDPKQRKMLANIDEFMPKSRAKTGSAAAPPVSSSTSEARTDAKGKRKEVKDEFSRWRSKPKQMRLSSRPNGSSTSDASLEPDLDVLAKPNSVALYSTSAARQISSLTSKEGLRDKSNPITHSTMGTRTMHYVSSSTGHQVANHLTAAGPSKASGYWDTRLKKLHMQGMAVEKVSSLFAGVVAYINGYTGESITNQELKRLLQAHGAKVVVMPSGSTTHILTSMALSGKKTQELAERKKAANGAKLVKVEWALHSVEKGKIMKEWEYAFESQVQPGIATLFAKQQQAQPAVPPSDDAKNLES